VTEYVTVKVPRVLAVRFDKVGERAGYRSFSEFAVTAVRRALEAEERVA
jgi:metal-responsive CopG/Arc/MetJ family transcriptional regulator